MLKRLLAIVLLGLWIPGFAQETHLRLAIVPEETSAGTAADVLTVEFSRNEKLQLLERAEIERVYREQGLDAAKNPARLGQVLGADGLLILKVTENTNSIPGGSGFAGFAAMAGKGREDTNQLIEARLVAVKQGGVIGAFRSTWSVPDPVEWAKSVGNYFGPFLPKLGVQAGQAIPISIVNLRSAVKSVEAMQTERQLTALTIERLTREQRLFILERRRLDLLSNEKEMAGGSDAEFWNGSYLLDGVVDRDGYSPETITINAQLTPAHGGAPLKIDIKGRRSNFADVVNALATKVMEVLKVAAAPVAWDPAGESQKYFEEAKWALRWGMNREAQSAAETAWALGKKDMDCAAVRVNAYIRDIPRPNELFARGSGAWDIRDLGEQYPLGFDFREKIVGKERVLTFSALKIAPEPAAIEKALYLLGVYQEFSGTLSAGEPKANSIWYTVGIDALEAGSRVLQWFYLSTAARAPVSEKLAGLRSLARSVAERISEWPSVRNDYFVGDRVATLDEFEHTMKEHKNIFRCMVANGAIWQDRPEDVLPLYRFLMSTPVYSYIHDSLWFRPAECRRLVGWTEADRRRIPQIWNGFLEELTHSTNLIFKLEGKAMTFLDSSEERSDQLFGDYYNTILTNRDTLVTNYVETTYIQRWSGLLPEVGPGGSVDPSWNRLSSRLRSEFAPQLDAMNRDYGDYNRRQRKDLANFEEQKRYLANFTPFDFQKFNQTFSYFQYTKAQATELLPLLGTYKSNLVAQMELKPPAERFQDRSKITWVGMKEDNVKRALNPAPAPLVINSDPGTNVPSPVVQVAKSLQPTVTGPRPRVETNALSVERFLRIPKEQLGDERAGGIRVIGHRLRDRKLLLDLRYTISFSYRIGPDKTAEGALPAPGGTSSYAAIAIYDIKNGAWRAAPYPEPDPGVYRLPFTTTPNRNNLRFELFQGKVYLSESEQIKKYSFAEEQWTVLKLPGQKPADLFVLNDRLFAGNEESIFEVLDGGKTTKVLASCRRRPPVTLLDSLETLGTVTLYAGGPGLIYAVAGNTVYSWNETDWKEVTHIDREAQIDAFDSGLVFFAAPHDRPYTMQWLKTGTTTSELCWQEQSRYRVEVPPFGRPKSVQAPVKPTWDAKDVSLHRAPVAIAASNLVFFVEPQLPQGMNLQVSTDSDANRAELVWLDRQFEKPLVIPIRFDPTRGPAPTGLQAQKMFQGFGNIASRSWLIWTQDNLFIGGAATPGVWALPVAELEARLAKEREVVRRAAAE